MAEHEDLLTVPQAAQILGVTQGSVRNAMYRGMLPFLQKYGRRLLTLSDLKAYQARAHPNGRVTRGRPPKDRQLDASSTLRANAFTKTALPTIPGIDEPFPNHLAAACSLASEELLGEIWNDPKEDAPWQLM